MRDDYAYWLKMFKDIFVGYGHIEILVDYRMRKSSVTNNKMKVIKPQWNVPYRVEKLGLIKSAYYLGCWAWISYFKYRK